ncbi:hypothetical protein BDP55DRAFT_638666 [Colletotrichum godetiae]|uniref:Methyltransferase domain-containing protein n=1 Tax=Colletotrichum godetiae TaxID=1209918 RepID=A0AAJ0A6M5_9PEZI|nr:uncharacterized protein BDP55DRAFT_638666 [Colletotrichum godetiae]KAK1657489.1 hypothetical protein BDP55DRAFT_638666 [Colletotrichum godetiae]
MAVPSATRQYPKNDTLAKAWDLLNHTLEIGLGHQSWSSVPEVKLAADFPTNSAIWLTRAADMRASNGLENAQFIGYRDPQLHPWLDSLDDDICLEVDPNMMWKERKYDLIHSRVIGYIENWPEYLRNVQSCLATAGVLNIEVVEMIPFTDEGSLPETSPLLKLSRVLYEPSETPEEPIGSVSSNIEQDIQNLGMKTTLTTHKLPIKHHPDKNKPLLGDWLASTMIQFIEANVPIGRETPARLRLDDKLVEAAKSEISHPSFHAYCNWSVSPRNSAKDLKLIVFKLLHSGNTVFRSTICVFAL